MSAERGPFEHAEDCLDQATGQLTDECTCDQRDAVQRLLNAVTSQDELRNEIAAVLIEHEWRTTSIWDDGTCACGWIPTDIEPSHREHQIDIVTATAQARIDAAVARAEQAAQRVRKVLIEHAEPGQKHRELGGLIPAEELYRALDGAE